MSVDSRIRKRTTVFGNWVVDGEAIGDGSGRKNFVYKLKRGWEYCALKVVPLTEEYGTLDMLTLEQQEAYGEKLFQTTQKAKAEIINMEKLRGNTHIVDYLDFDFVDWSEEDSFGRDMYIRMELLTDLRTELKHSRVFPENEIIKIGCDICKALSLCHSKGIIHRDIKPDNIFVNKDGNYKLGDFGISKSLPDLSQGYAGTGIGTFAYLPAEQLKGKYTKTVDIYSLGLVLYELSNGNRLPFATNAYATDQEVIQRLSGQKLPKPSNASEKLAKVILKACAFNPKDRYASAEEFLSALEEILAPGREIPIKKILAWICAIAVCVALLFAVNGFRKIPPIVIPPTSVPETETVQQHVVSDILEGEWNTGRYSLIMDEDQHLTIKISDEFLTNYNTRDDGVEGISIRLYHDTEKGNYYNVDFVFQAGKLYGSVSYYAQGMRTSRYDPEGFSYTEYNGTLITEFRGNIDLTNTIFDIKDVQIVYLLPHNPDSGPTVIYSTFEPTIEEYKETEPQMGVIIGEDGQLKSVPINKEDDFILFNTQGYAENELCILGYKNSIGMKIEDPYIITSDDMFEFGFVWEDNSEITATRIGAGRNYDINPAMVESTKTACLKMWGTNFASTSRLEYNVNSTFGFIPQETYYALLLSFDKNCDLVAYTVLKIGYPNS